MLEFEVDSTLSKTIKRMLQLLMTHGLARQFSFTGLGVGRKRCKLQFNTTSACRVVQCKLYGILFSIVSLNNLLIANVSYDIFMKLYNNDGQWMNNRCTVNLLLMAVTIIHCSNSSNPRLFWLLVYFIKFLL